MPAKPVELRRAQAGATPIGSVAGACLSALQPAGITQGGSLIVDSEMHAVQKPCECIRMDSMSDLKGTGPLSTIKL